MKRILIYIAIIFSSITANGQLVINNTHVDLWDDIPENYMNIVKSKWINYVGRSHGQAALNGIEQVEGLDANYDVNVTSSGTPEAQTSTHLRYSAMSWGTMVASTGWFYESYYPYDCWTTQAGRDQTYTMLDYCHSNFPMDYFSIAWSWDGVWVNDSTTNYDPEYYVHWVGESLNAPEGDLPWGLDDADTLETNNSINMLLYCNTLHAYNEYIKNNEYQTRFFYSTGPIGDEETGFDSPENQYQQHLKWEYIRDYIDTISDAILFDWADICSYNDAGLQATTSWTDHNNIEQTFAIIHPDNFDGSFVGHMGEVGALRIGKALWVMIAMDAGWDPFFVSDTTNWYLSNNGNDSNSGHHPDSAIATLSHLHLQGIDRGDSIFFEKGGVWREQYMMNTGINSGQGYVTFTSYGTGKNPQILGSTEIPSWIFSGTTNIWQSSIQVNDEFDDALVENYFTGAIYFILLDDSVVISNPFKTYDASFTNLTEEFDITTNNEYVYIYSVVDPNMAYKKVEASQIDYGFTCQDENPVSYITWENLDFKFNIISPFHFGYPEQPNQTDLAWKNCTIQYIGVRGGNAAYGIQSFHSNTLVENCYITDCGRRGISVNLYESDPQVTISNIIVRNNHFKRGYHTTALDLSNQLTEFDTIKDVYFYNNIVDDSDHQVIESHWTSNQVFFQVGDSLAYLNNIHCFGNLLINATARHILYEGSDTSYTYNNTVVNFDSSIFGNWTLSPYQSIGYTGIGHDIYFGNNIMYDNLGDDELASHGMAFFEEFNNGGLIHYKDRNLYYQENPGIITDRNFTAHPNNGVPNAGTSYWNTTMWDDYIIANADSGFDANSPVPQLPDFVDYEGYDFHLSSVSPAIGIGAQPDWVIVTDQFNTIDTINKYDLDGKEYSITAWDLGAYTYSTVIPSTPSSVVTFRIYYIGIKKAVIGNRYLLSKSK